MMKIIKLSTIAGMAYMNAAEAFEQTSEEVRVGGAEDDDLESGHPSFWYCLCHLWLPKSCGKKPPQPPPKPPHKEGVCAIQTGSRRGSYGEWTIRQQENYRFPPLYKSDRRGGTTPGVYDPSECYNCIVNVVAKIDSKRNPAYNDPDAVLYALDVCGAKLKPGHPDLIGVQDPKACNKLPRARQWPDYNDGDCAVCVNQTGAAGTKNASNKNGTSPCGKGSKKKDCTANDSKKIGFACGSRPVVLGTNPPINNGQDPDDDFCASLDGYTGWTLKRIVDWRNPSNDKGKSFVNNDRKCVKCIEDKVSAYNDPNATRRAAIKCGADKNVWTKNTIDKAIKKGFIPVQDPHACEYYDDPSGEHAWCQDNKCIKCVNNNALAGTETAANPNGRPACDSSRKNPFDLPKCDVRALKNAVDACGGNAIKSWPGNQEFRKNYPLPTFDKKKDRCPRRI